MRKPTSQRRGQHQLEEVVEQQRQDDETCLLAREQDGGERHADRSAFLGAGEEEGDPVAAG